MMKKIIERGIVEKITVLSETENGKGEKVQCLRLLQEVPEDGTPADSEDEESAPPSDVYQIPIEQSPLVSLYDLIDKWGTTGITQKVLFDVVKLTTQELHGIVRSTRRWCHTVVQQLINEYGVVAVPELCNRQMTYRLYTRDHAEGAKQHTEVIAEVAKQERSVPIVAVCNCVQCSRATLDCELRGKKSYPVGLSLQESSRVVNSSSDRNTKSYLKIADLLRFWHIRQENRIETPEGPGS